jgi:hypothetical protein
VAGLGSGGGGGGGGRGGAGGGEKFDPDDPTTAGLLIRTLQQNESRNESTHAYLESLEATVSLLEEEHGALDSEAASLIATEERASTEAAAVRENDEKRRQAEVEDERRCESLEARLLAIRPSLSGCVARLGKHVESLDFPESTNAIEREGLTPLPARSLPAGLQPPPKDALPLHTSLELELEGLDGLLQGMAARCNRLVHASKLAYASSTADGEAAPEVREEVRVFTELPPEFSLERLKETRAELEEVISDAHRRKGDDD